MFIEDQQEIKSTPIYANIWSEFKCIYYVSYFKASKH